MSDYWKKKLEELNQSKKTTTTSSSKSTTSSSSYWEDRMDELKSGKKKDDDDDIAPVKTVGSVSQKTKDDEEDDDLKWYQKGHFEDGWDFGDVTKTILGISPKKEVKTFTAPETTDTLEQLKQKQEYYAGRTWKSAEQREDAFKVTQQYNQMALAQYSDTLSKTKMDGQNHTVLEEIGILANMKSGGEKDKRKQAVLDKMESLGMDTSFYSHFAGDGEFDWGTFGKWLGNSALAGLNTFNKGLLDTADVLLGAPLKALGWENNPISKGAEYYGDLYSEYRYNANILAEKLGGNAWNFGTDFVEGTAGAVPFAIQTMMSAGTNMLPTAQTLINQAAYRAGNVLTKAGLTVESMMKNPQFWTSFSRSLGSDYKEAKENGASDVAATIGSVLKSFVNAGIEIGPGGDSGIQGLPQGIKEGGKPFWEWIESSIEEGGEEMLQKFVGEIINKIGYGSEDEILNPIEYAKEGAIGTLSGMALGGGQIGLQSAANAYAEHQANKPTANEKAVIKREVEKRIAEAEKKGEKLTAKQKSQIEAQVEKDMEKGYISIDTIEEVLGGESRTAYDSLAKESEEFDTLYDTAYEKLSEKQRDRLAELKKKNEANPYKDALKATKDKLSQDVYTLAKGDRLVESYNERTRRGQAFEADLSKYDKKLHSTIQKAVDSGILNNTNRTHEFVDMVAKISADKGVLFDFTNNEKLKNSGFAVDGKSVNGYVTKDGITVNIQSSKALNSIVGHEITHVLEGTDLYTELQSAVVEYAKAKNDYQGRYDSLTKLYEGIEGANVDAELTADLVGDYLFTDSDFINNLSTNHRNVFQKIYDEVKYLLKVATAGSKEARELEKVKRAFDKAYRESAKAQTDTKYSIVEIVDENQQSYGTGVHLDSTLLDNLSPEERVGMVKEYVKELGGESFTAYDPNGNSVDITIAKSNARYKNHSGKKVQANRDLTTKFIGNEVKQEAIALIDELIVTSEFEGSKAPNYPHGWLDNNGRNNWEYWKTYIQDKNNTIWEATLNVANSADGEKILYDINPIKKVGQSVKSDTIPTADNVSQNSENVKYSLSDSNGRQLSNQQQEYFKDSVVRDENGNLKVMYHGTSKGGFNVFDTYGSNYGLFGTGSYFTDSKTIAESYTKKGKGNNPQVYEAYLNIKNPMDMDAAADPAEWAKAFPDADFPESGTNEQFYRAVEDFYADQWMPKWEVADEIQAGIESSMGYDGITHIGGGRVNPDGERHRVYIAFQPEQIKSVANTKPTPAADIRYSLSDSEGTRLTEDQQEYFAESKARDENGNLYALYHGSRSPLFTEFDMYEGVWLTPDQRYAEVYAEQWHSWRGDSENLTGLEESVYADPDYRLYKMYANIKNPLDLGEINGEFDRSQMNRLARLLGVPASRIRNISHYNGEQTVAYVYEVTKDHQFIEMAREKGYDGFAATEAGRKTFCAFDAPNQVKLTTNEVPSGFYDVRYSLSYDTEYMDRAIAKNESTLYVNKDVMNAAKATREKIANRMNDIKDRGLVALPDDLEGNTAISNSSYDITEENTTICPRSLAAEAFVDAVSEYLGRPLSVDEQIYISQDLQGRSLTPECTYCYVATDRKAYRAFLGDYISQRDAVLQKVQANPDADVSRSGALYKEFLNGRKDTNPMYSRFKMWVDAYKNGKPMVEASHLANISKLMGDIKSEFGAELKPQIVDAMKYAQSASWAKKRVSYVAYDGHILKWKQDRINKLNSHYGLRMYSFSDFHPAFVLENMQMITDASVRGLKMLGYTKDTDFVEIFAPSGMNINISTFGFETGGNVYENNIIGAEWEKAKALREQYPNVGITFVATNDHLVNWALEQDWIDVVIPYHLVRTGAEVAKAFGYTNYTSESSDTKTKEWAKGDQKYIAPTEHNNDKATYLAALKKNHLNPRFERFIDNPNYMKLVNECRQPASQSKPVQPVFNEEAAMVALAKLEANGYYQPIGGSVERMYEIAAEVAEDMTKQLAPTMSLSEAGEQPKRYGSYNIYGKDIGLQDPFAEFAPVAKNATTTEDSTAVGTEMTPTVLENRTVPEVAISEKETTTDLFPDDLAPIPEEEVAAFEDERLSSLSEDDMPPEVDAPYPDEPSYLAPPGNPFDERDMKEVGKRNVNAYMFENPEVKPFFQSEANIMLGELKRTVKGERIYNEEGGWTGTSRYTSDDIAYLRDEYGYTYAEIEKGLNAIIQDNGKENNAVSKRIEFILNDRLLKGYREFETEMDIPADQDYINLVNEKRISEYSEEAFARFMATADQYAPMEDIAPVATPAAPKSEDIAPIKEEYVAVTPKRKKEPKMVRADKPFDQKTANVLVNEPKVEKKKNGLWSMVKENVLDNGMVFEDLALKTKNRDLQAKWNFIRYAQSMAQRMVGNGTENVKSLDSIRQEVEKSGKTQEFYEYLYHWLNVDRMTLENRYDDTKNKAVFGDSVTADMSRAVAVQLGKKNPEFRRWAQDVYRYNSHLRTMMVNNGVISQETAELWQAMYPHYVPIRRVGDKGLNINVPLDTGRTGVNAPIKKATGGNSDILPLFDTMAQRTLQTYKAIAKNSFGVELKNTLGTTITKEQTDVDGVLESVDNHEELLQKGKNGKKPTFTVFENGEKVTFEITDEMYNAMKPAGDLMSYTNPVANRVSNFHRGLLTEYNPVFMATNAIKDTQDILINSQHPVKTYANLPRATWEIAKNGKWFREYMEHGGEDNTYFDGENNSFDTEEKGARKLLGIPPLSWISKANNFIERTPRLAEYIASRESGRSIEVSMLDAARVTTNFAAGGKLTKLLNRNGATFLNASVQGVVQQARNFREAKMNGLKGWAQLAGKFALAGLPAMLLNGLMWDDDDEYEELSDYVKQNYYIVGKYGDGKFVRIPKGRTLAVIQNAFEQMENAITGDDEVDLMSFVKLVVSNLAPNNPVEDNILAPIIQVSKNETWYGEDLVPTRLQDLPAAEQFDESTDAISKWLGEKLNFSPYKINYLLDQYSGGVGDTILPMLTPEAESGDNTLLGNMLAPWKSKFATDSVMNNQNVADFYDVKDELTTNAKSSKATDEDVLMSKYMNAVNAELSDLYAQKREIQNSGLSAAEKYAQVRNIQSQIVSLTKEGLATYKDIVYEGEYARIGDRLYTKNDEGEWQKLSDEQVTKYEVTKAAGDAPYATDGTNHYRWYEPGEDAGEDAKPGWRKVTEKELERQNEVTSGLGITPEEYWGNKEEYSYAYDNPESYAFAKALGGYKAYKQYSADLNDIKRDKDKYGKPISGSREPKVLEYINSLDADYYTKLILYKSEFTSYDDENYEIIEYLNGRKDISFEEEIDILRKLGFSVTAEGNISW